MPDKPRGMARISEHGLATHAIFISRVNGRFREDARPLHHFRGDFWDLEGK